MVNIANNRLYHCDTVCSCNLKIEPSSCVILRCFCMFTKRKRNSEHHRLPHPMICQSKAHPTTMAGRDMRCLFLNFNIKIRDRQWIGLSEIGWNSAESTTFYYESVCNMLNSKNWLKGRLKEDRLLGIGGWFGGTCRKVRAYLQSDVLSPVVFRHKFHGCGWTTSPWKAILIPVFCRPAVCSKSDYLSPDGLNLKELNREEIN